MGTSSGVAVERPLASANESISSSAAVAPTPRRSALASGKQSGLRAAGLRLVRLAVRLWPLPLRSISTYSILFGLSMLSLVLIDEVATQLTTQHHEHLSDAESTAIAQAFSLDSASPPSKRAAALLHIIRHSFAYRCLLCICWIVAMFLYGLYSHRGKRNLRRSRRSVSGSGGSPVGGESGRSSSDADLSFVAGKSVSFAGHPPGTSDSGGEESDGGRSRSASDTGASPAVLPRTGQKRLRAFFVLALLLALCGVAFEFYLAVLAHGREYLPVPPHFPAELVPKKVRDLWERVHSPALAFSWAWLASMLSRALLLLVWSVMLGAVSYHFWYRKAIGPRKSMTKRGNSSSGAVDTVEEEASDEGTWSDWDDDDSRPEQAEVEEVPSKEAASSDAAPPAAASAAEISEDLYSESEWSEDEEESATGAAANFSVPPAAKLLLDERLDASLFFHPEQPQNQWPRGIRSNSVGDAKDTAVRRAVSLSATTSPTHVNAQNQVVPAKKLDSATHAVSGLPPLSPTKPPLCIPLSTSSTSPLNSATLYHLASTKFISGLSHEDFAMLLPELHWQQLFKGNVLFRRGDRVTGDPGDGKDDPSPSDGMFIVVSGTIGALQVDSDEVLSTFHQGDSVGELEFLFNEQRRSHTMQALTPVQLLRIPTRLGRLWSPHTHIRVRSDGNISPVPPPSPRLPASPMAGPQSVAYGADLLRSDILLSFVRTTLARQWRSAQFILDEFLQLPLTAEHALNGEGVRDSHAVLSRYFSPALCGFFTSSSPLLQSLHARASQQLELAQGQTLFEEGSYRSGQLFVVLAGNVTLSSKREGSSINAGPGSVINAVTFLTDTVNSHACTASTRTKIAFLTRADLAIPNAEILQLALLVCRVLAPTLSQYQSLGFQRQWIRAGTLVFREGEQCEALYVLASGRVRIVTGKMKPVRRKRSSAGAASESSPPQSPSRTPRSATSSGSSSASSTAGASRFHPSGLDLSVFSEAHRYASSTAAGQAGQTAPSTRAAASASARIKFELGRGELVGEMSFFTQVDQPQPAQDASAEVSPPLPTALHSSTALCSKDCELIKISRPAFENLLAKHPRTLIRFTKILAARLRNVMTAAGSASSGAAAAAAAVNQHAASTSVPRSPFLRTPGSNLAASCCMSVCLLSASPAVNLTDFALQLSVSLSAHGRTMLLTPLHVDRILGEGTCAQLNSYYYRSLFSYWLSAMESTYAFLIFVAEAEINPWTRQALRQADLTLVVANAQRVDASLAPTPGDHEEEDDDEEPNVYAAREAKRRRRTGRAERVSRFERLLVWEEGGLLPLRRRKRREDAMHTPEKARVPGASAVDSKSSTPEHARTFSPTLHPSPVPLSPSSSKTNAGAAAMSTTIPVAAHSSATSTLCAPRMHFSLRDLVLLHPASADLPRGTRFWLRERPDLHRHHHIAAGCEEHMSRLARYIAGKTVGVVMSGGGARGLAHLGVVRSFAEQGVPIDYVGGTSQGSFMAALYASQPYHHVSALAKMAARVHLLAERMGSIRSLLSDATFPVLSYFAGEKFGENISAILGKNTRIEDLWIQYFCVTTNLSQADMQVHEQGRLWKAVRASMTVLDYLPPMQMSRAWPDLLIDGGYTNNLPVDVMHGLFQPRWVIGIDVENKSTEEKLMRVSYYGKHLKGWWLLRTRLKEWLKAGWLGFSSAALMHRLTSDPEWLAPPPFSNYPRFGELVGSLLYINHNRNIRQSLASKLIDLYIRPELGTTALLDYHKEQEVVEIGYRATKTKLTEWRLRHSAQLPRALTLHEAHLANSCGSSAAQTPLNGGLRFDGLDSVELASGGSTTGVGITTTTSPGPVTRRKSVGMGIGSRSSVGLVPPSSLTFTQDLTRGSVQSAVQRNILTGSPLLHVASYTNLAHAGGGSGMSDLTLEQQGGEHGHAHPVDDTATPAVSILSSMQAPSAGSNAASSTPASGAPVIPAEEVLPPPTHISPPSASVDDTLAVQAQENVAPTTPLRRNASEGDIGKQ